MPKLKLTDEYEPKRRIVLYGPPKSGKTTSLATVPKGSKMYMVDVDRQLGEFLKLWKTTQGSFKNLEVYQILPMGADTDAEADRVFDDIQKAIWNPPQGFDFYTLDSYTTLTLHLTHVLVGKGDRQYNQKRNTELSSWANDLWHQFVNVVEIENPESWSFTIMHEDWREVSDGLSDPKEKKSVKNQTLQPTCATSARNSIPANVDFVWHVEKGRSVVGGKSRSVSQYRTTGSPLIMASSVGFSGELETMEDADLSKILPKIDPKQRTKKRKR